MSKKKFCANCGIRIKVSSGLADIFSRNEEATYYEYKDGLYCVACHNKKRGYE